MDARNVGARLLAVTLALAGCGTAVNPSSGGAPGASAEPTPVPTYDPDPTRGVIAVVGWSDDASNPEITGITYVDPQTGLTRLMLAGEAHSLGWSPDGSLLAATREKDEVVLLDRDGEVTLSIPGGGPSVWSPDSRHLLIHRPLGMALLDVETGVMRDIGPAGWSTRDGSWSPDGSEIVFSSDGRTYTPENPPVGEPDSSLFRMTVADGAVTPLTDAPGMDVRGYWSPDGGTILFQRVDFSGAGPETFLLDVATGELRSLGASSYAGNPWSPDGSQLLLGLASGGAITDLMGMPIQVLWETTSKWIVVGGSWSPDGASAILTLSSALGYPSQLMTVRTDGSGELFTINGDWPAWQPDPA
jgi:dipeptidyl aminopeptidase/acylaminoacyl peptidase